MGRTIITKRAAEEVIAKAEQRIRDLFVRVLRRDFSGLDLRGFDLRGLDFSNTDFTGADLRDTNLAAANLRCAIFTDALLLSTNLRGAIGLTLEQLVYAKWCGAIVDD